MESGRVHAVNKTMHGLFVAAAIALLAPFVSEAKAQKYPERPVKIVLPFGAGGVADVTARILAEKLGDRLGQLVGDLRVIKEGVTVDDRVIVNGLMRARPGQKVTPQEQGAPPAAGPQAKTN